MRLTLTCGSPAELSQALEQGAGGALLVPAAQPAAPPLTQFDRVQLEVTLPGRQAETEAEVLQMIPGVGVVVRVLDADPLARLVTDDQPDPDDQAPTDNDHEPAEADPAATTTDSHVGRPSVGRPSVGITALSWPIEELQLNWHALSMPEKVRVARYGKRPARGLVIRGQDKTLHAFVLGNPKISADEVAALASKGSVAPELLQRIATSPEWTRHTAVVRNLICHPKLPIALVRKLLTRLSQDELRRIARSGKVRAAVKRIIIAKVEGGR